MGLASQVAILGAGMIRSGRASTSPPRVASSRAALRSAVSGVRMIDPSPTSSSVLPAGFK